MKGRKNYINVKVSGAPDRSFVYKCEGFWSTIGSTGVLGQCLVFSFKPFDSPSKIFAKPKKRFFNWTSEQEASRPDSSAT